VRFDLLVVGDANPDVVLTGVARPVEFGQRERLVDGATLTIGGSGAITACGAARLGLRTAFVGRVGDDPAGRYMLSALAERGVDVSGCVVDPSTPTAMTVVLADGADRAILTYPGCLPLLSVGDVHPGLERAGRPGRPASDASAMNGAPGLSARHVHVSSYFLQPRLAAGLPEWFAALRRAGVTTSLDTNDDPAGAWDAAITDVDVLLPNEAEALALTGLDDVVAAGKALAASAGLVVVKRGASGAVAWRHGAAVEVPALPAAPVDTVGAGDSFNAGFLAGWLGGRDLAESLRLAVACGTLSTRAAGGTAAQPTMAEALAAGSGED
jgi:sugar/nucleoside kinase (ribokinase family)